MPKQILMNTCQSPVTLCKIVKARAKAVERMQDPCKSLPFPTHIIRAPLQTYP